LNDHFGHKTGDDALVHLVAVIRETVRPSDSVARFGGEEFVIVLPEAGLDEAMAITSRVQRALTRRFFLANNERLLITFSAGVALHDGSETRDAIIARADAALYRAKRAGKNRVIAAS
jgi:diguanylate cyclase